MSVNLVPLLFVTGVRHYPPGRTDKNLCRCFGAPACRVFPDRSKEVSQYLLLTYLLTYLLTGEPRGDEARPEPRLQPRRREVFTSRKDGTRREGRGPDGAGWAAAAAARQGVADDGGGRLVAGEDGTTGYQRDMGC